MQFIIYYYLKIIYLYIWEIKKTLPPNNSSNSIMIIVIIIVVIIVIIIIIIAMSNSKNANYNKLFKKCNI